MTLVLAATLAACSGGKETTLTGMVVSADGTVISLVELDAGSMDDIKAGTFVTITMNGKGEVTHVLVSSQSSFGGRFPSN